MGDVAGRPTWRWSLLNDPKSFGGKKRYRQKARQNRRTREVEKQLALNNFSTSRKQGKGAAPFAVLHVTC
jgi:hypothetical protein